MDREGDFGMTVALSSELVPTDNLLDAWARDRWQGLGGGLHPLEVMRLLHEGVALGEEKLSTDDILIIVDQAYLRSPPKTKALVSVWYQDRGAVVTKAKRLGISRSALYTEWRATLHYFRGVFRTKGLKV
jgi:hypothetical protein